MANFSSTYPATRPVFMADFANGGKIDPRATFSRASTANVFDGSKHLSSENLFKYSNDLGTGWVEDNLTFTSGQTAPDGGSDAYKVTENSANNEHRSYPTAAISTNGGPTTLSGHFKYIGRQWILFRLNDGSAYRRVWFDIQNGVLGTADTGITASITASGNGFYKCVATIATSNTSYLPVFGGAAANTSIVYTGSGADAFYVWGLQYNHNVGSVLNETSGQIHREYAPTLVSKANNAARFETATDGQSMGLLVEGQAQNLATYSSDFSNAAWTKTRTSVEASAAIGPDGTLSASLIRDEPSTNNTHHVYQLLPSIASGTVVTASVFAKAAGRTFLIIQNGSTSPFGGASYKVWFNLTSGTVGTISGSGVTASATDCGNGWTRCTVTFPASTVTGTHALQINSSEGDNDEYHVGDSYSGVLLFGAQYEQNSFPSSLISTSGSQVTRAADSLSVATADIGYTGGDGSLFIDLSINARSSGMGAFLSSDADNYYMVGQFASTLDYALYSELNNSAQINQNESSTAIGSKRLAASWSTNDASSCINGGTVATDTSNALPLITDLHIGSNQAGAAVLNGHVKRVALYSEALTDTNLQALTS